MGKIYLINAGNDDCFTAIANDATYPALGVVSLATVVNNQFPQYDVNVFDGQVQDQRSIIDKIQEERPDLVGVSVLSTSYQNALAYARAAKEVGATVIFGNDQAALLGKNMLSSRDEIDYICSADVGEFSFLPFIDYMEGKIDVTDVPQLLYRSDEGIKLNRQSEMPEGFDRKTVLDLIPTVDRTLLPQEVWEMYAENYRQKYGDLHDGEVTGVTTMNRARGCARVKNKCCYCGIKDLTMRFSTPEAFWDEARAASEQVGANVIYEVFDSMSSAPKWVEGLIDAKPDDLGHLQFFVYAQALETTPKLADLYKELGVFHVNMGLDSGDDTILKRLKGERDSVEQNWNAVNLFHDRSINVYASFVLGVQGESRESLENTVRFAEQLVDAGVIAGIEAQPLYPEFNAQTGKMLLDPALAQGMAKKQGFTIQDEEYLKTLRGKYLGSDNPDPDEISRDWARVFCEVSYDDLVDVARRINGYAAGKGIAGGSAWVKQELEERKEND